MAGLFSRIKTWVASENLKAADVNAEFNNIISNCNAPQISGDSPTVARMQATEDPGAQGTESLATSVAGELRRLRYVLSRALGITYWYDAPDTDLNSLYGVVTSGITVPQNRIDSGRVDTNGQPMFLIPNGSTGIRLKASVTEFKAYIKGVLVTVNSDVDLTGLSTPSSFTCLVNDASLAGTQATKTQGEQATVLTIDTNVGSAPTAATFQAWKIVHSAVTEYFFGRFDSTTQISACHRGMFFNSSDVIVPRVATSNDDQITLCKAAYVFFTYVSSTPALEVTYNLPVISGTQPTSASSGDWWLDLNTNIWKKYNGTSWADGDGLWIGMAVMDGSSIAGTRSFDFGKSFSALNTVTPVKFDSATIKSRYAGASIHVYGTTMKFDKQILAWSMASDLDSGVTEAASTTYYFYLTQYGVVKISDVAPHRRTEDLFGFYHPSKPWRCIGYSANDSGSDLGTAYKVDAIDTDSILNGAVTQEKRVSLGQQLSSDVNFNTNSATYVDVTNATVTITTTGRPVMVAWVPYSSPANCTIYFNGTVTASATANQIAEMQILRGATQVLYTTMGMKADQTTPQTYVDYRSAFPPLIDTPVAGTYTYKLQAKMSSTNVTSPSVQFQGRLMAFEL